MEETIGHPPQEPSAGGADRSLFSRRAVLKQAEHAAGGAWTSGAETRKRQCGSGVPEIATKARLTLSPRADSALCVWQRVAMLWVSGSFWRFSRLAAVACGPVAAGDLAACDGDGRCWGGMVAPDGVAAGGKPVIDGGIAGAAAGAPLADARSARRCLRRSPARQRRPRWARSVHRSRAYLSAPQRSPLGRRHGYRAERGVSRA